MALLTTNEITDMNIEIKGSLDDIAARGFEALKEQGTGAWDGGKCLYHCEYTGSRCIIGLLVTEDEAKYLEDKWSEAGVSEVADITFPDLESWEYDMIDDLQSMHDTVAANSDDDTFVEDLQAEYATFRKLYVKAMDENQ